MATDHPHPCPKLTRPESICSEIQCPLEAQAMVAFYTAVERCAAKKREALKLPKEVPDDH